MNLFCFWDRLRNNKPTVLKHAECELSTWRWPRLQSCTAIIGSFLSPLWVQGCLLCLNDQLWSSLQHNGKSRDDGLTFPIITPHPCHAGLSLAASSSPVILILALILKTVVKATSDLQGVLHLCFVPNRNPHCCTGPCTQSCLCHPITSRHTCTHSVCPPFSHMAHASRKPTSFLVHAT